MKQKQDYQDSQEQPFRFKKFERKGFAVFNSMYKVVHIGVLIGCALCAMFLSEAHAQTAVELEEVTVTASRIETPLSRAPKPVTVITAEEIRRAPVQSIQDLLLYAAGVDVVQRGGHGVQADLSIRGGSFDQNAILLNGVNLTNAHTGHYNLDLPVNLSDVERIEIIHGPSALVYGAGAFSGGINIVTKKKATEKLYARTEAGMYRLRGMEVRATQPVGSAFHSLSASHNTSAGYILNSDYALYNLLWQTRLNLPGESRLDLQIGHNDKRYGANTFYSARFPNQYDQTSSYMGSVKGEFGRRLRLLPILYWSRHYDRFDLTKGSELGRNYHRNDALGGNLIFLYRTSLGNTSLGSELRRESILSSNLGKPLATPQGRYTKSDARTTASLALEHTLLLSRWTFSAGMLWTYTTLAAAKPGFYPSVSAAWHPSPAWKLSASWSKSTRMPTFTDLYYSAETHNGNEGLRPEKSESLDLGLQYVSASFRAYLRGFLLGGRDLIDWVKVNPYDTQWASWNLTEVNTRGLELGFRFSPSFWLPVLGHGSVFSADYVRMGQSTHTQGFISMYALNYLRDKFTLHYRRPVAWGLSAGAYFRFQKRMGTYERFENLEKTGDVPYPAFSTLDLRLDYSYRNATLYLNLNNLYNTHYFDKGNVPQPGFWLTGGVVFVVPD
ncbi:MAG: TonB-dependent receptor [Tannerellaceae bacterium]|jgi:iron complex outermembrane receptor protein|nr:TonB-dependent receptor [Tannerellaceae bacterium]